MTDCGAGAERPIGSSAGPSLWLQQEVQCLRNALREAIRTSPGSFLTTVEDVDGKADDYWIGEIRSSTWVVAERDGAVVGIAAGKAPDGDKDPEDRSDSRYIESVWIAPGLRGNRLGKRLITYLMAAELRKNPNIKQFLLWVFETNSSAISLYKHMKFSDTQARQDGPDFRTEIKYRRDVNHETWAAIAETVDESVHAVVKQKHGVTYRVVGERDSTQSRFR